MKKKYKYQKRWNFICSYAGITIIGAGIFFLCFFIYLSIYGALHSSLAMSVLLDYPACFLKFTTPFLIIMAVFLFICNITMVSHEGFRTRFFLGSFFGITCLVGSLLFRKLFVLSLIACYYECIFFGTGILSYAAALHHPALDNDYLIILGCYIGKQKNLVPLLRFRINRAMRFAWEQEYATGKAVCFVPSGGKGNDEVMSEAAAMTMYLMAHSAEHYEVLPEKASRNTRENFLFSKKLIDQQKTDAKVTYVTTNYHVLRAGMLAKKAGLRAEGLASDTKWYYWPNGFVREFVGILYLHKLHQAIAIAICIGLSIAAAMI